MSKKLFTAKEVIERRKVACRVSMRKKRAKTTAEADAIVAEHKRQIAAEREKKRNKYNAKLSKEMEELELLNQQKIERQRLRDSQEKLFKDDGTKLQKQEQLQSDLIHWLEMNPISNPSFWKVYEKLRECEVRIMQLTKSSQCGGSGGIKEFSTFNLKTA